MLVKTLGEICLLRADPQDLPASRTLMLLALLAHVLVSTASMLLVLPAARAMAVAVVDTLILVAVADTALLWLRLSARATQTVTALAGCSALLALAAGLVSAGLGTLLPAALLVAGFLAWQLLVLGHIFRHALSVTLPAGMAVGLLYIVISVGVGSVLVADLLPQRLS